MLKNFKILSALGLASLLATSAFATETAVTNKEGNFFIGFEGGIAEPLAKSFKHVASNTKVNIKRSHFSTGILGYHVEQGLRVSLTGTYQPNYSLAFKIPDGEHPELGTIPLPRGKTKARNQVYMLNVSYDLADLNGFTPYVTIGAGVAQVKVKPISIYADVSKQVNEIKSSGIPFYIAMANQLQTIASQTPAFKTIKHTSNNFAWQAGLGVGKEIAPGLRLNVFSRLHVVNNIKIKYEKLQNGSDVFTLGSKPQYASNYIKKTLGVGEFGIGFTYDLPF